jgi:hypothetical protein
MSSVSVANHKRKGRQRASLALGSGAVASPREHSKFTEDALAQLLQENLVSLERYVKFIDKSIFMCYHNDSIANHHTSSEVLS